VRSEVLTYQEAGGIYVMDADGDNVRQLTSGESFDHSPSFSPDNNTIAFVRETYEEATDTYTADIFTVKLDSGAEPTKLTDTPKKYEEPVAFSPDGTQIAFSKTTYSSRSGSADIFVMRVDGSGVRRITDTRAFEFGPDWQPIVA